MSTAYKSRYRCHVMYDTAWKCIRLFMQRGHDGIKPQDTTRAPPISLQSSHWHRLPNAERKDEYSQHACRVEASCTCSLGHLEPHR